MARTRKSANVVNQTPEEKFVRLAEQRTGMALKYLALVGNLAGPGYESTEALRTQIVEALQAALDRVKDRFGGKAQASAGFRLTKNGS